jgi:hypothetical protein
MELALWTWGYATDDLDDEEFARRLRAHLATLTGGSDPQGFECTSAKAPSGDYLVLLIWSENARHTHPHASVRFSADGATETLAFLRAALKALQHPEYRELLFRAPS